MTATDPFEDVSDASDDPGVQWRDGVVPYSSRFGDTYFSDADGRAETREVFLGGNGFPARWTAGAVVRPEFLVAELGFGTGLNFLETVAAWRQSPACRRSQLRFVSFERFPMSREDLFKAVSAWPDLGTLVEAFLGDWPATGDVYQVHTDDVLLDVHIGDARENLRNTTFLADAWYLDGFSPAQNPELWGEALLDSVFAHTTSEGTFSTYTAAGWVRRNLTAAGFDVARVPGFGRKRERLQGIKSAAV